MGESSISLVIEASVEPATVLRVNKISFGGANVRIPGHGSDFGRSVTRSGLRGPNTNFPTFVEDKSGRTSVLKDGVIVLVLILATTRPLIQNARRFLIKTIA